MRNFSLTFDNNNKIAVASIDGNETYRIKTIRGEDLDNNPIVGYIVEVMNEMTDKPYWSIPEDHEAPNPSFEDALMEILYRLQNDITIE